MGSLWNRSGLVERYADDLRAGGALAYFYNGGTTTPLSVYQDSLESAAHPFPVVADANGRWPDVFIPYITSFDVQVKTAEGVQLTYTQRVPNPDPVDLTVTADPTTVVQTGMIHAELVNTTKPGYVRLNGKTLGNAASTGTERAHADTSALFNYLWNNLPNSIAAVSGGRGASAAADFAANKTIVLPSCQGTAFVGLDDMGNTPAGSFGTLPFTQGDAVTPGSGTGANSKVLDLTNVPAHTHTGSTSSDTDSGTTGNQSANHTHNVNGSTATDGSHTHGVTEPNSGQGHRHNMTGTVVGSGATGNQGGGGNQINGATGNPVTDFQPTGIGVNSTGSTHSHGINIDSGIQSANHNHAFTTSGHSHTFTTSSQGSGQAFNNMPLARLVTWYIKL